MRCVGEHVSQQPDNERASQPGDKLYPYDRSIVHRIANTEKEMNECADAIRDTISPDKIVGFDTETKVG